MVFAPASYSGDFLAVGGLGEQHPDAGLST